MPSSPTSMVRALLLALVATLAVLPALVSPAAASPTQSWTGSAACAIATANVTAKQGKLTTAKKAAKKAAKQLKRATKELKQLKQEPASATAKALTKAQQKQKAAKQKAKKTKKAAKAATAVATRANAAKASACLAAKPISASEQAQLKNAADMMSVTLYQTGLGAEGMPPVTPLLPAVRKQVMNALVADASEYVNPSALATVGNQLKVLNTQTAADAVLERLELENPAFAEAIIDSDLTAIAQLFADSLATHALPGFITATFDDYGARGAIALAYDEIYGGPLARLGLPAARSVLEKIARGGTLTTITRRDAAEAMVDFFVLEEPEGVELQIHPVLFSTVMEIAGARLGL